ncbi:MAG: hypothetical protein QOK15_3935 [Nocardioidaceae bacterium]|nr:hypothetical protein [Nocardioidaceae bacterium]
MAAEIVGNSPESVSATPLGLRNRPWHVLSGRLNARLDDLVETDVWSMDGLETAETIVELARAQAKLAAVQARLLAHAERLDVAASSGATSTAAWLRGQLRVTPGTARAAVGLAKALDTDRYPTTAAALAAGQLLVDQARVVIAAVDALPDRLFGEERLRAEAHLVELARSYDAEQLARLGRHLLEVIDPEMAEQELAKRLAAEDEAAARATVFRMVDDGHGKAHGKFVMPSLHGQMLRKLLEGFANPQIPHPIPRTNASTQPEVEGDPDSEYDGRVEVTSRRHTGEVLGDALVRLIETYPLDRVPLSGGLNATVVVTMPVTTLQGGLAHATIPGTGTDLSAETGRRLACAAGVIPAVMDGPSRVLDLGRRSRLASPAQRLAKLIEQDGVCAVEDCDRPASWADAHHWKKRWADGGTTNLDDLVLICPRHHTIAHLPGRQIRPVEDGGGYRIHHQT